MVGRWLVHVFLVITCHPEIPVDRGNALSTLMVAFSIFGSNSANGVWSCVRQLFIESLSGLHLMCVEFAKYDVYKMSGDVSGSVLRCEANCI